MASDGLAVNDPRSGNQVKGNKLSRMRLKWKDFDYYFAVNPEDYTQAEPNKATVTQTKGGAWIDAWGEGIKEITIKGTTGVTAARAHDGVANMDAGYQRWKSLRNMIQNVYDDVQDGGDVELMEFYNFTDNEYFYVYPAQGGIELLRNKSRPHIYQYTLHLWAVRRIGQPLIQRPVLGDPTKTDREHTKDSSEDEIREELNHTTTVSYTQSTETTVNDDVPESIDPELQDLLERFLSGEPGGPTLSDVVRFIRERYEVAQREAQLQALLEGVRTHQVPLSTLIQFLKEEDLPSPTIDAELQSMLQRFFVGADDVGLSDILNYVRERQKTQKNEYELWHMLEAYRGGGDVTLAEIVAFVKEHIAT